MISGAIRYSRVPMILLSLLLASGSAYAGTKLEREERKVVPVTSQSKIFIKNARGKVIVVGEVGASSVTITAQKWVRAKNTKRAEEIMRLLTFEVEEGPEEIVVRARAPKELEQERSFWSIVKGINRGAYIDFTVEVPKRFGVKTETTSGDVRVTNVAGAVAVNATSGNVAVREIADGAMINLTSGDIDASDLGGDLRIIASSGNAQVKRILGKLVVETTSGGVEAYQIGGDALINLFNGDLVLDGCLGNLKFKTASGDARIVGVLGGVDASSSSGDLDVVIIPIGDKEFVLNTSSGDIVLDYLTPTKYGFLLDVSTCTGAIKADMAIKVDKITRQELRGIVGTGKSKVIIETASGNVIIKEMKGREEREALAPPEPPEPRKPRKDR